MSSTLFDKQMPYQSQEPDGQDLYSSKEGGYKQQRGNGGQNKLSKSKKRKYASQPRGMR